MHPALTPEDVLATGGWHPDYVRVLATASDGDHGVAIVDGNGDGAELEEEAWFWEDGQWRGGATSGAGPLDFLGAIQSHDQVSEARYAYGRAVGRDSVRISFNGQTFEVPVGPQGVWAFIKIGNGPAPSLAP
ncbi:MAG TPA: hypothetical protein VHU92_29215 [Streptosporangiaceae bacterium]|jgi:hypothetical protein|nr:hypothetical protein [Streptosporangiaceae bacterium]